jgi:hypothetical protein
MLAAPGLCYCAPMTVAQGYLVALAPIVEPLQVNAFDYDVAGNRVSIL